MPIIDTADGKMKSKNDVKIVIIGAGIAGISAAHCLYTSGFTNITVLEASERIGGRIHSIPYGKNGCLIDLGAQFIHGASNKNSVYELAKRKKLLGEEVDWYGGQFVNEHGHKIPKEIVKKAMNQAFEVEDELEEEFKEKSELNGDDVHLYGYLNSRFRKLASKYSPRKQQDAESVFNYFLNLMRFDNAENLRNLNSLNFGQYISVGDGEDVSLKNGFQSVIDSLLEDLPDDLIRLNMHVTNINWFEEKPNVTCEDGQIFTANHVIVTCSLGYLQKHHSTFFTPQLHLAKSQALSKIGFGTVNKIFLYYKEPFWTKGQGSIRFAWTNENREINDLRLEWYKAIHGFDELHNNTNVLMGSIVGDEGRFIEGLDKEDIKKVCTEQIRRFLNIPSLPEPSDIFITKWSSSKWTFGSYCYMTEESKEAVRMDVNSPLCNAAKLPVLMFAGEACHLSRFSTADGARSSGIEQAQKLMNLYTSRQ